MKISNPEPILKECIDCKRILHLKEPYYHWRDVNNSKSPHIYRCILCVEGEQTTKKHKRDGTNKKS